jgi:hypothetical protein
LERTQWDHSMWNLSEEEKKDIVTKEANRIFSQNPDISNRDVVFELMRDKLRSLKMILEVRETDCIVLFDKDWKTSPFIPGVTFPDRNSG